MRVLLNECLPKRLKALLIGHEVRTVPEVGWAGKKNGELLKLAAGQFDAFITIDINLVYQQNLQAVLFGVVVLTGRSNRLADLQPIISRILDALADLQKGQLVRVGG